MRIVCVDPGTTTGVVVCDMDVGKIGCFEISSSESWPRNEEKILNRLQTICKGGVRDQEKVVVIEDFFLRPGQVSLNREVLSPVRIGFALFYRVNHYVSRVCWQMPSDAIGLVTDERLRDEGLWVIGSDHCRDAMRHYLLFCRKNRMKVIREEKMKAVKVRL